MDNISYKDLYKDIRKQSKISFRKGMLAGHFLTRDIGRICSVWFIKHNIIPNQITLLMILFGIVGSILFTIPDIWCKIGGYLCWLLWFAMDCSDGQVARYTKNFSKYGTEMDYMAHLIDHSFMNFSIWITFLQIGVFNPLVISGLFIIWISCELVNRNIVAFEHYENKIYISDNKDNGAEIRLLQYLIRNLFIYPTFIICFSWIIIIDYKIRTGYSIILIIIWLLPHVFLFVRNVLKTIIWFYKG